MRVVTIMRVVLSFGVVISVCAVRCVVRVVHDCSFVNGVVIVVLLCVCAVVVVICAIGIMVVIGVIIVVLVGRV